MSYDTDGPDEGMNLGTFIGNWEVAISEVYSVPRVAKTAEEMGFKVGSSIDLMTVDEHGRPWDFTKRETRNHAYRRVCEEKPFL